MKATSGSIPPSHLSALSWGLPPPSSRREGDSLDVVLVQQTPVLLEEAQVALQGVLVEGQVQPRSACETAEEGSWQAAFPTHPAKASQGRTGCLILLKAKNNRPIVASQDSATAGPQRSEDRCPKARKSSHCSAHPQIPRQKTQCKNWRFGLAWNGAQHRNATLLKYIVIISSCGQGREGLRRIFTRSRADQGEIPRHTPDALGCGWLGECSGD